MLGRQMMAMGKIPIGAIMDQIGAGFASDGRDLLDLVCRVGGAERIVGVNDLDDLRAGA
jgi:hypothetical protein